MIRIAFAAVVAITGKPCKDGRTLVTPEGFVCPSRPYPLPVYGRGSNGRAVAVGHIETASIVDHRVIVFGHLFNTLEAVPFTHRLEAGTAWLEIDVDQWLAETAEVEWMLAAAFVGDKPAWDLPPVQIEELSH
jgi:hypothetical protein